MNATYPGRMQVPATLIRLAALLLMAWPRRYHRLERPCYCCRSCHMFQLESEEYPE